MWKSKFERKLEVWFGERQSAAVVYNNNGGGDNDEQPPERAQAKKFHPICQREVKRGWGRGSPALTAFQSTCLASNHAHTQAKERESWLKN